MDYQQIKRKNNLHVYRVAAFRDEVLLGGGEIVFFSAHTAALQSSSILPPEIQSPNKTLFNFVGHFFPGTHLIVSQYNNTGHFLDRHGMFDRIF